ncbi:MAG: alpha/beta fold hydrolase [Candidatus Rokubacteria bacterium]|nr:alpha/beta fold hydrolase [Candidatus Rokubacteria bacterium]
MKARFAIAALVAAAAVMQELAARWHFGRTRGPDEFRHETDRSAWTPAWHEAFVPAEWTALRLSRVYRGDGVPRGDGAPVVLVHGFLTRGDYLSEMRGWLERIGYDARVAPIGWNTDCPDVLTNRLLDVVAARRAETGRAVHLVGHSLGGVLARAAAARARDAVASVATLSAPFRGISVHPALNVAARIVRDRIHRERGAAVRPACFTFACDCPTVQAIDRPLPADLPQLAIVTRFDGLVDWRYCLDEATTRVVHVTASHIGLAFNAQAYEALAAHLGTFANR